MYVTLSMTDTQHNNDLHFAECPYAECLILLIVLLSVVILNVIMLSAAGPFLSQYGSFEATYRKFLQQWPML